jgi:hypothetical protein
MEWIPFHKEMPPMEESGDGLLSDFILLDGASHKWRGPCVGQIGLRSRDDLGNDIVDGRRLEVMLFLQGLDPCEDPFYLAPEDYPTHWSVYCECPDSEARKSLDYLRRYPPMYTQSGFPTGSEEEDS